MKPARTHFNTEQRARKIFQLRALNYTHQEIADQPGCERSNVTYYLTRAKASLRDGVPFLRTNAPR